jgi:thioredoxin 1
MRIKKISGLILLFCLTVLSVYGKEQGSGTNKNPGTVKEKATFIELGSVNCIPCKKMQPVMRQIEKDYAGVVKVVFYDVWTPEQRSKGEEYGIRAIPTQVFLDENGKEFFRHIGYFPVEEIEKILTKQGISKQNSTKKKSDTKPAQ